LAKKKGVIRKLKGREKKDRLTEGGKSLARNQLEVAMAIREPI